jgi:hypothetical protein
LEKMNQEISNGQPGILFHFNKTMLGFIDFKLI